MRVVIHYVGKQGAILVVENAEYPYGMASEQALRLFAKEHLNSLALSQRCVAAIEAAIVYTQATSLKFQ